ncbi:MAG: ABC transporter permease [Clostridium sp.]|jgi:spermidine/putrescine transport system permease protein|uniref:ABC transporter permease n=1 Tax=Clostridium sp. TaxID=1506 RepID=UPI0025BE54D5|nr:ABC transporter permease [Clostridium sp.]MCH3963344.1 ABC transporter permease [Clostridium sp.]MCI1716788.1 ABC transporter permease [Clostridium sp.]MCI1801028.1 ABC transporter permease [Clostridium sp.]MCI1814974.1 ABC transporter permease [Clostridium sp.]MCI1871875.1 ABC transporter permease [Clostridium sp.]
MKNVRRKEKKKLGFFSYTIMFLVYLFLYLPIIMVVIYSFNVNDSNIVFKGFTLEWYRHLFQGDQLIDYMILTIELAVVSTVISVVLGTLATICMYRYDFRLKKFINNLLYIPIVIPELIIGIASLAAFTLMGFSMGFATLVFAHVTFCVPFVIITLRARIADFDRSIEEAAMDLGANQWRTLKRVTLPMLVPGIVSGAFLSITLSVDDVIISYFVCGAGQITFPIKVYGMVRGKISTDVYALSSLVVFVIVFSYLMYLLVKKVFLRKREA